MTELELHDYTYYPYERELAAREAAAVLGADVDLGDGARFLPVDVCGDQADRLVYFSGLRREGRTTATVQAQLEDSARTRKGRQATRYSVHGLHEYKGKFNPQVAKALLNIFGVGPGKAVLDPFCGSGTTLVEAVQLGAKAHGVDVNPMAVFVTRAKIIALQKPAAKLEALLNRCLQDLSRSHEGQQSLSDERLDYLSDWFDEAHLELLESLRNTIVRIAGDAAPVLLTIASDLLRDYSLQEPQDLRIRRRKTPLPDEPLLERWERDCRLRFARIAAAQGLIAPDAVPADITLGSAANVRAGDFLCDAAVTSPPYAMALPYVDTQRLSLVWLGLSSPRELASLDASLIGSRETRGRERREIIAAMDVNAAQLPPEEITLCRQLAGSLTDSDGFRRQAVPGLLYRYFAGMAGALKGIVGVMKPDAPFALIVGHNHTTLGGVRFEIDTPRHLANLGAANGWDIEELMPLQTYRRYGLHASNAVSGETLVILRAKGI